VYTSALANVVVDPSSSCRPDFIKFDEHFIQGINDDSFKRHFVDSLQNIARGVGCQTIAEGIETELELQTVHSLGVHLGQGHYLARPASTPARHIASNLFYIKRKGECQAKRETGC
jgi:EAL domain-containing protein (putative c-di-GMP-specific phosphodiesterase class I)